MMSFFEFLIQVITFIRLKFVSICTKKSLRLEFQESNPSNKVIEYLNIFLRLSTCTTFQNVH